MGTTSADLKLVVHKGTSEIGGTCIELSCGEGNLLLDIGLPLAEDSAPVDVSKISPDAVFVSHPHQDHYGLIESLDTNVPLYMGEVSRNLIEATRVFLHKPPLDKNIKYFKPWKSMNVCGFTVTPYLVDHSAPDAYAFLLEDGKHRIFYSGDFRAHGRKSVLFQRMVEKPIPDLDVLLMEGSMLHRDSGPFHTEEDVEAEIRRVIERQDTASFIISSAQNIDRVVSAFKACRNTGRTLVVDVYGAWVLEQLKIVSTQVPNVSWEQMGVYVTHAQYETVKANRTLFSNFAKRIFDSGCRVTPEMLNANPQKYLIMTRLSGWRWVSGRLGDVVTPVIYSQWLGYLDKANWGSYGAREVCGFQKDPRIEFVYAHTSGHATVEELQTFAKALCPKMLVPIHTEYKDDFPSLFENVRELSDGEELLLN